MLSIVREQGGEGSAPVVVGGGWLSADLPCYCPELYGSYPAVPGTLSQPGGEGSGCVCVCVCGGGGGSVQTNLVTVQSHVVVLLQFPVLCHNAPMLMLKFKKFFPTKVQCQISL